MTARPGMIRWRTILVIACVLLNLFPFYWMVSSSLKESASLFAYPPTFLPLPFDVGAYVQVFRQTALLEWLLNSVRVAVPTTVLALVFSVTGAYALSRFKFRGRGLTAMLILVTQMLPGTLLVIPLYLLFKQFGLLDTHVGLIIAYATFALPFSIWMLKGYFDTIPLEIEEAAIVDGCTRLQVLARIVLPLSLPGLTVTAMFAFILAWNDLILAVTLTTDPSLRLDAVGLASFIGEYGTPWGLIMSASTVSSLPILILFLFAQRYLLAGLTAGAVKG